MPHDLLGFLYLCFVAFVAGIGFGLGTRVIR